MDGFFGIGILELFVIAILALIVLGPERLPGVMREGAKYIRALRKMTNDFTSQFSDELKALDELNPRKIFNEMTDPNQPEPGEKPKAQPAKPPPAKTTPTGQTSQANQEKPKTASSLAPKPGANPAPPANGTPGVETSPPAANGHETAHAAATVTATVTATAAASSPGHQMPEAENPTILPPGLHTAASQPANAPTDDASQPASSPEAVAVGEPAERQL